MRAMSGAPPISEGFIPFRGHRTWYRVCGDGESAGKLPLVLVNGGPGAPHDYFEPLADWAQGGRRIVFYDQLGSGDSDHPHDPALWSVDLFVAELRAVREALGLGHCHLLGQSWGGPAGAGARAGAPAGDRQPHARRPAGERAAVGAPRPSACAADLPADVQATLTRHEAAGTTDSPEYEDAHDGLLRPARLPPRPVARVPAAGLRPARRASGGVQHDVGPERVPRHRRRSRSGTSRARLPGIAAPALVLGGRHDECTPAIQEDLHRRLPGSEWVVFEESAHVPHLEEPERFREVVEAFLDRVERGAA